LERQEPAAQVAIEKKERRVMSTRRGFLGRIAAAMAALVFRARKGLAKQPPAPAVVAGATPAYRDAANQHQAAKKALEAGVDVELPFPDCYTTLPEQVQ
jgi:anti-sigma factor RsiW